MREDSGSPSGTPNNECLDETSTPQGCQSTLAEVIGRDAATAADAPDPGSPSPELQAMIAQLKGDGAPSQPQLALQGGAAAFANAVFNDKTARFFANLLCLAPEAERTLIDFAPSDPGLPKRLWAGASGTKSAHPVYKGIGVVGTRGVDDTLGSFYLKPTVEHIEWAAEDMNIGTMETQLTTIFRSLNLSFEVPEAYLVQLVEPLAYTLDAPLTTRQAVLIADADQPGKVLVPLRAFLDKAGGGIAKSVTIKGQPAVQIPEALRSKLLLSMQLDAILRYLVGDFDGHTGQFLVRFTYTGDQCTTATLVSLDRGAAGSISVHSWLESQIFDHAWRRLHLLDRLSGKIDLGGGYSLPISPEVVADFSDTIKLARQQLRFVKLDQSGNSPLFEDAYQRFLDSHLKYALQYAALASKKTAGSSDSRAKDKPDAARAGDGVDRGGNNAPDAASSGKR